jgi:hypothetical protein
LLYMFVKFGIICWVVFVIRIEIDSHVVADLSRT